MAAAAYDPGKATPARLVNEHEQLYAVDSFREPGKSYLINLKHGTCDCPDFQRRGQERPCKHLTAVRNQARWLKLQQVARACSDRDLERLLVRYQELGDMETSGAIRVERARRKQAKAEEAKLKAIFA